ncbi:DUF4256 domain-containing protein [Candidatus Peregrinibacteria bacterium]|nr:DUF4256 domain-containing protein [Candidatus Peregrinibacteria bacterium]
MTAQTKTAALNTATPEAHLTLIITPENQENSKKLTLEVKEQLLQTLEARFRKNMHRHTNITWEQVAMRLNEAPESKLWSLSEMERTGGEPDVTARDEQTGELTFIDLSPETPKGRRKCAYDQRGEKESIRHYGREPKGNAIDLSAAMGITILTKSEYRAAQKFDKLDLHSYSWILTPDEMRKQHLALYGRRRVDLVRIRKSNTNCDMANMGFRGSLKV